MLIQKLNDFAKMAADRIKEDRTRIAKIEAGVLNRDASIERLAKRIADTLNEDRARIANLETALEALTAQTATKA